MSIIQSGLPLNYFQICQPFVDALNNFNPKNTLPEQAKEPTVAQVEVVTSTEKTNVDVAPPLVDIPQPVKNIILTPPPLEAEVILHDGGPADANVDDSKIAEADVKKKEEPAPTLSSQDNDSVGAVKNIVFSSKSELEADASSSTLKDEKIDRKTPYPPKVIHLKSAYRSMKLNELKPLCLELGLKTTGSKMEIVERLEKHESSLIEAEKLKTMTPSTSPSVDASIASTVDL